MPSKLQRSKLVDQRGALQEDLRQIVEIIGDSLEHVQGARWAAVAEAMRRLNVHGRSILDDLFGERTEEVAKFCRSACRWSSGSMRIPSIEISSRLDDLVPFELLPLLTLRRPPQVRDLATLSEAAHRILAFPASFGGRCQYPADRKVLL